MTFNQEYYYTLLVTAETQHQPADAIPVLVLAAYKQAPQTGSCLSCWIPAEEAWKSKVCEWAATRV